jgi:asparagine synthase (glutamine-hydrolysing)
MCGIAGVVSGSERGSDIGAIVRRMCAAIRHRGPDEDGFFDAAGVSIGMRRLSIIDIDGGSQPISNEDGSVHVVFNGEIYNYRELRAGLERKGHRFATHTDTEVLVHLYEEYGHRLASVIRGMFAFAIWDARAQALLLGRDRLGIKPLYYTLDDRNLSFASELGALRLSPQFDETINEAGVARYLLLGYLPDPHTIYESARKLPPGHLLEWEKETGKHTIRQYWSAVDVPTLDIDEAEAVVEVRRLISEAVQYRLIADVPLGAFLSGGLDSSVVASEMSRQMERPVKTFSIGFEDPRYNEAPYARAVADAIGADHTELIVRPDVDALVDEVLLAFDEPFADSSAIPTYLVSQLARRDVKVVLSGDGGDEAFAGYSRYSTYLRRRRLAPQTLGRALRAVGTRLPFNVWGRNRLIDLGRSSNGRYASSVAVPLAANEGGVAQSRLVDVMGPFEDVLNVYFDLARTKDSVTQLTVVDILSYLPGDILTKVDRASMAVSLEARVPLLDHKLVEFALALPGALKWRDGQGKKVLRKAAAGLVPDFVLTRGKKGFSIPLGQWLRHELRHRTESLLAPASHLHEYVDALAVRRLCAEHFSGRRDHGDQLWRLIVLDMWLRRY